MKLAEQGREEFQRDFRASGSEQIIIAGAERVFGTEAWRKPRKLREGAGIRRGDGWYGKDPVAVLSGARGGAGSDSMLESRPNAFAGARIVFRVLAQSFAEQEICAACNKSGTEMRGDTLAVWPPALPPIRRNVIRMADGGAEYDFAHLHCAECGVQVGVQTLAKIRTHVPRAFGARGWLQQAIAFVR